MSHGSLLSIIYIRESFVNISETYLNKSVYTSINLIFGLQYGQNVQFHDQRTRLIGRLRNS